ncbi:MAG: hypothetical protein PHU88_09050 [candidate division Zixibacteria bacterium]|nr:hypothetical protein [candidate division Zixibacteria bacterium]MDD5426041.1 hypothetical protein [candidate division Zixibacteria bacterium]
MNKLLTILLTLILSLSFARAEDSFEELKKKLAGAKCIRFDFLTIIESEIFDRVDTAQGTAYVAADNRYRVTLGNDEYLYNGEFLYSYIRDNNQVTVEKNTGWTGEDIVFITRLDSFYISNMILKDNEYRLIKKDSLAESAIPDSLRLFLDPALLLLKEVRYFDVNEELNRLIFLRQDTDVSCDEKLFLPDFPDSVPRIKLW